MKNGTIETAAEERRTAGRTSVKARLRASSGGRSLPTTERPAPARVRATKRARTVTPLMAAGTFAGVFATTIAILHLSTFARVQAMTTETQVRDRQIARLARENRRLRAEIGTRRLKATVDARRPDSGYTPRDGDVHFQVGTPSGEQP